MAATLSATAHYMAFTREGPAWKRWLILTGSIAATVVVGVGRVLSAAHFTTDVLTGAFAGAAIGVLVPHAHRISPLRVGSVGDSGATLVVRGTF